MQQSKSEKFLNIFSFLIGFVLILNENLLVLNFLFMFLGSLCLGMLGFKLNSIFAC